VALGAPVIGVNNRNLQTLETSLQPSLDLLPRVPRAHTAVSESGIFTAADVRRVVEAGAHAVLVGEGLVRASDVRAKVREADAEMIRAETGPAVRAERLGREARAETIPQAWRSS